MGKTIYIATQGEYSDYQIKAVFSTESKANKYKSKFQDVDIKEFELNSEVNTVDKIVVEMREGGEVLGTHHDAKRETGFCYFDNLCINWVVETDLEKRAIKVVNEKRMQILALNLWDKVDSSL